MQELILKPNQKLDEHLEHFNPDTKKWELCNSIEDNQCVFIETPHRIAFGKTNCICGKSMNYLVKQNGHLIRHFKEKTIEHRLEKMVGSVIIWEKFYKKVFGIKYDFSDIKIPKKKKGFNRLVIMAEGITIQQLYDKCNELFPCIKWTNKILDQIIASERTSKNGSYAILIRDEIEADDNLKNICAEGLEKENILGITIEEMLIYHLKYFEETGEHLDIKDITLCTGSRCSNNDDIIGISWWSGKLVIDWYEKCSSSEGLCCREIVC